MSGLVYPANLPGLTWDSTRTPVFNTGIQQALSSKESAIAYQQYPVMEWELQYELLRDYTTPSDIKALVGLFMAVGGKYDSFLYTDPEFNSVIHMPYAITDGSTLSFQLTATYQNSGGPGGAELIQNCNPQNMEIQRYGPLIEYPFPAPRTQYVLRSQDFTNAAWTKNNLTAAVATQAAPDGTFTANVLNDNTTSSVAHDVSQNCSGATAAGIYTGSVFIWSGATECRYIYIILQDAIVGDLAIAVFDKNTGTVVSTSFTGVTSWSLLAAQMSVSTTVSGSAWYRISLTATKATANSITMYVRPSSSAVSSIYAGSSGTAAGVVWGAQLEKAAVVQPAGSLSTFPTMYLPTVAATVTQQDWVGIGPTGIMSFTGANLASIAGIQLLWSGSFFYRVRFDDDSMTSTQFMKQFWENKKVRLRQRKL